MSRFENYIQDGKVFGIQSLQEDLNISFDESAKLVEDGLEDGLITTTETPWQFKVHPRYVRGCVASS